MRPIGEFHSANRAAEKDTVPVNETRELAVDRWEFGLLQKEAR